MAVFDHFTPGFMVPIRGKKAVEGAQNLRCTTGGVEACLLFDTTISIGQYGTVMSVAANGLAMAQSRLVRLLVGA